MTYRPSRKRSRSSSGSARGCIALVVLAGLLFPSTLRAWDFRLFKRDFSLNVTETLGYTYHFDNENRESYDDKYHDIYNTLDVSLSHDEFRLGARLDFNIFADTPFDRVCFGSSQPSWCQTDLDKRYVNHFAAERLYLIWARPEFDVTLGDFYASFGKGIALNVVKIDELGQDTAIRGGKFDLHHGDVGLIFLAGEFNPLDTDLATGYQAPWPAEPVVAGRLEYRFFDRVLAGTHAVFLIHDDPTATAPVWRTNQDLVWGVGTEVPDLFGGRLSLGGEFDLQRTVSGGKVVRGPDADHEEGLDGLAGYGSATLQLGDLTALAEYKYYDNFELKAPGEAPPYALYYHQPPTLERKTAKITNSSHVSGTRLRLDYNFGELGPLELLVYVNYGYFEGWKEHQDTRIHDPFGGVELQWQEGSGQLQVESGLRRVSDRTFDGLKQDIHLELDVEQAVLSRHSIKLSFKLLQRSSEDALEDRSWRELDMALSYKWSPYLVVGFTFERQEDPQFVDDPRNYYGGTVRYFINPGTYINLRVGENREDLKCISGVCRYYPPFSGVSVEGVARF